MNEPINGVRWDAAKSAQLKRQRGFSFEEMLREGRHIVTLGHPRPGHQRIALFEHQGYIWVIPFVEKGGEIFLKTMFPSRQYTKRWKRGDFHEEDQAD
jgi:hypothetical protein